MTDGSIQLVGGVSIDEVNEIFGFGFPTDEATTVAGMVVNALGRIASIGDEVEINTLRIRVDKIDRLRIATATLFLPQKPDPAAAPDSTRWFFAAARSTRRATPRGQQRSTRC
jgi:putative hemolysin